MSSQQGIPLIPITAMAGFAAGDSQVIEYECERYIIPMFRGADFLISVKGSSMVPKYNSGDVVACKQLPLDDLFFQWNKVYVLDTIQGALVKRIKRGIDEQHVLIVSDNTQYEPFQLHRSQIRAVALVIGVIRLE
jgi:phage repressor protein C with HTH and peptisase S24 domain